MKYYDLSKISKVINNPFVDLTILEVTFLYM